MKDNRFSRRCQCTVWMGFLAITFSRNVCAQQPPDPTSFGANYVLPLTTTGFSAVQQDQQSPSQNAPTDHKTIAEQTVGVLRNRSIFFPDLATNRNPLTPGETFKLFVDKTIAPSTFVSATASSAYHQALDSYPGWGQGWGSYGSRYGAAVADSAS